MKITGHRVARDKMTKGISVFFLFFLEKPLFLFCYHHRSPFSSGATSSRRSITGIRGPRHYLRRVYTIAISTPEQRGFKKHK